MGDDQDTRQAAGTEVLAGGRAEGRSAKKTLILLVKIAVMLAVLWFVGKAVFDAWVKVNKAQANGAQIAIDWRWGILGAAAFCGSMLTSAIVWRWLARRMGDRTPAIRAVGAYTFSQMGKYVPGKVALLLMRIERAGRFGMSAQTCTLSTLLENALYMVSGGIAGMLAVGRIAGAIDQRMQPLIWPATLGSVAVLLVACYPPVFYALVNRLLGGLKKPQVKPEERLGMLTLATAIVGFMPCWLFGGLALWASMQAVQTVPPDGWLAGAFALSVIIGMGSFLPGGLGIREAVILAAVTLALEPALSGNHALAVVMAGIVAVLQRVFQLAAELLLGVVGTILTRRSLPAPPLAHASIR